MAHFRALGRCSQERRGYGESPKAADTQPEISVQSNCIEKGDSLIGLSSLPTIYMIPSFLHPFTCIPRPS